MGNIVGKVLPTYVLLQSRIDWIDSASPRNNQIY
jgi:hypothetical protein